MARSSAPPSIFEASTYTAWHEGQFASDAPLAANLEKFCADLKKRAPDEYLNPLAQLLTLMSQHCSTEASIATKALLVGAYHVALPAAALRKPYPETTFKSPASILDKLWRKNSIGAKTGSFVSLANIKSNISDLIRTSIIAPTLYHARFFADHFVHWDKVVGTKATRRKHFANIKSVTVDPEAKLASGYFAYHCSVEFADGQLVEVQVYSQLTEAWRRFSHHLYEKTRLGRNPAFEPGSAETSLVSLGHLLHLAEGELERLAEKLK